VRVSSAFESQIVGAPDWLKSSQRHYRQGGADVAYSSPRAVQKIRICCGHSKRSRSRCTAKRTNFPSTLMKGCRTAPTDDQFVARCQESAKCGYNGLAGHLTGGWITTMLSTMLSRRHRACRCRPDRPGGAIRCGARVVAIRRQRTAVDLRGRSGQLGLKLNRRRAGERRGD
jgi:hypothetical protein